MIPENTQHWPYLTISFSFQNCSRIAILPLHSQGAVPSSKSSGSPQLPSKRVEFTCDDTKEDLKAETIESSRTRYTRLPLASSTIFPANCFQNLRDTFWFHRSLWGRVKNDLSRNNCSIIWLFSDNEQCLLVNRTGLRDVKKQSSKYFCCLCSWENLSLKHALWSLFKVTRNRVLNAGVAWRTTRSLNVIVMITTCMKLPPCVSFS